MQCLHFTLLGQIIFSVHILSVTPLVASHHRVAQNTFPHVIYKLRAGAIPGAWFAHFNLRYAFLDCEGVFFI